MSLKKSAHLDGYVRVSRLGGRGEENLSTVEQRRRIEGYCQAQGHSVREWFVETDESGRKSERAMWQEALARLSRASRAGLSVRSSTGLRARPRTAWQPCGGSSRRAAPLSRSRRTSIPRAPMGVSR